MSLENLIQKSISEGVEKAFTPDVFEEIALQRFNEKLVNIQTVADILGVHVDTVRNYVKYGFIEAEPRISDRSTYKFQLSKILKLKKEDLR